MGNKNLDPEERGLRAHRGATALFLTIPETRLGYCQVSAMLLRLIGESKFGSESDGELLRIYRACSKTAMLAGMYDLADRVSAFEDKVCDTFTELEEATTSHDSLLEMCARGEALFHHAITACRGASRFEELHTTGEYEYLHERAVSLGDSIAMTKAVLKIRELLAED